MVYVFTDHWAVKVTVPLVERRFLNEVSFVLLIDVLVVVDEPYVCVTLSMPVICQPVKV